MKSDTPCNTTRPPASHGRAANLRGNRMDKCMDKCMDKHTDKRTGNATGSATAEHRRNNLGMNLGEMLLSLAIIAAGLGLLMSVTHSVRADNADQQTRQVLRSLRLALDQYQLATKTYPPEPASIAIHYLQTLPASEAYLRDLRLRTNLQGFTTIADGYGRPIQYLQTTLHGQYQPDFVSPGPDGKIGDLNSEDPRDQQAISDNVYGRDVQLPGM